MRLWFILLVLLLPACSQISFFSKPVSPESNAQTIQSASPSQEGFRLYLAKQSPALTWPIQQWDLNALTLCAWYFHPALKVAKSDYAVALAGITTAGLRPQIGMNGLYGLQSFSGQSGGDSSPFLYNIQIDIPVVTNGKREINIDIARYQADIAKIQFGEIAWQLRYQLALDLLDRAELIAIGQNLLLLQEAQSALLSAFQKRLLIGMIGKADLLPVQLQYEQSQWQLAQNKQQLKQIEQKITHDAGLTAQHLVPSQLSTPEIAQFIQHLIQPSVNQPSSPLHSPLNMQAMAMTNRMDIQRGLLQYAHAEAKLKLEMAKQIPDITLGPGMAYEYGARVWSLGIGSLLNILNPATALWQQADAVRQNEADRFYALQHQVIQQCEQQSLKFKEAYQLLGKIEQETRQQPQRMMILEQQFRQGLIDKTELLQSKILFYTESQRLITQRSNVLRAALEIENTMQAPFLFPSVPLPVAKITEDSK